MEWVEVTARTVEEAKDKALDYLGVDESQAEFEIIEEPRTGLFGRLKGEARVRARVQPTQPRPKLDRRDRRKRKVQAERGSSSQGGSGTSGESAESRPVRPSRGGSSESAARTSPDSSDVDAVSPGTSERGQGGSGPGRDAGVRNRRSRGTRAIERDADAPLPVQDKQSGLSAHEEFAAVTEDETEGASEEALAREVEAAETFLEGLLDAFGMTGGVEVVVQEDEARELRVSGTDLGLLIGPRGGTIQAVQELTRLAARRNANGRGEARIRVDVGGYRERRREALARFARGLAEEVARSGAQKVLEPMSSPDRKVVHDAASEVEGVATLSEGEEPRRRVVIVPRS